METVDAIRAEEGLPIGKPGEAKTDSCFRMALKLHWRGAGRLLGIVRPRKKDCMSVTGKALTLVLCRCNHLGVRFVISFRSRGRRLNQILPSLALRPRRGLRLRRQSLPVAETGATTAKILRFGSVLLGFAG